MLWPLHNSDHIFAGPFSCFTWYSNSKMRPPHNYDFLQTHFGGITINILFYLFRYMNEHTYNYSDVALSQSVHSLGLLRLCWPLISTPCTSPQTTDTQISTMFYLQWHLYLWFYCWFRCEGTVGNSAVVRWCTLEPTRTLILWSEKGPEGTEWQGHWREL